MALFRHSTCSKQWSVTNYCSTYKSRVILQYHNIAFTAIFVPSIALPVTMYVLATVMSYNYIMYTSVHLHDFREVCAVRQKEH